MNSRAHLTPEVTTDKNGKKTTVYRRVQQTGAATGKALIPSPTTSATQLGLAPSIASMIDTNSTVSRDRKTLKQGMTTSMTNNNEAYAISDQIKKLDRTTLMLAASAVRKNLITNLQVRVIDEMLRTETREYVALATQVRDFEADAIRLRVVYYGARPVNDEGTDYLPIDLSTDESISRYASIMRFSLAFQRHHANTYERFQRLFTVRRVKGRFGQVLNEDLQELVSRRPKDINAICDLMRDYSVEHAAAIEDMLDHGAGALSEGIL